MSLKDTALKYISYGLSVIPTNENKIPVIKSWKEYQSRITTKGEVTKEFIKPLVKGIAIICGAVSGNKEGGLEVIDVDTKYDLTGKLWEELYKLIEDNIPEIFNSLVIAQTKSGGYHIYYKCNEIKGNLKLANRKASAEELEKDKNDKVRVLIETRGEGGYVIAPDTKGYKFIKGSPDKIPLITPEQREKIFFIAKSFNEIEEPVKVTTPVTTPVSTNKNFQSLGSFEDYNERGDIIGLLISQGWSVTKEQGDRIYLKRAGDTKAESSGNFHTKLRVLYIFSTSTVFEAMKGYSPSSAYATLECNGDLSLASKRLTELGYGAKRYKAKAPTYVKTDSIQVEGISKDNEKVILSKPSSVLKVENVKAGDVVTVNVYYTASAPPDEILQAVALLENSTEAKIYLKEVDTIEPLSKVKEVLKPYEYKLYIILNKYSDKEINSENEDEFLQEVVSLASTIQEPIDRDRYIKTFLEIDEIKDLGISETSIEEAVEKIKNKKDKVIQEAKLKALLDETKILQDKGDTEGALDLLQDKIRDVKAISKTITFESLLIPIRESELRQRLQEKPISLSSGYSTEEGEELLLPAGALTIFSAPTSHGKTTMLLNLALNTAEKYPEKEFHIFSYEEDRDSVILKALNIYTNERLSKNNLKTLKSYYSEPEDEKYTFFNRSGEEAKFKAFEPKREKFFKDLIDSRRLNIHYVDYTSDTLLEAMEYLNNKTNVGAVYIDYMQLLRKGNKTKYNQRYEELKDICLEIKDTAVNTGLPIILGAQFNRQVINHLGIHPTNISEAGDIERIANTIIGFWNNNFKPLDLKDKDIIEKFTNENTFYCKVLKMREGKVGSEFLLNFTGNTGKIENNIIKKFN